MQNILVGTYFTTRVGDSFEKKQIENSAFALQKMIFIEVKKQYCIDPNKFFPVKSGLVSPCIFDTVCGFLTIKA